MNTTELIKKAETGHSLEKNEIVEILKNSEIDKELFAAADRVRAKYAGNAVHLRGLIEFSNTCKQNCCYCGLRRDNLKITRYRMEPETVIEFAEKAHKIGYKTVVLQSGEDNYYTLDKMECIIKGIKKLGVAMTLSVGEKTFEEYKMYREWGADRFLLRIETTNKKLYEKYDPGMDFDNRMRCLNDLKKLGYEVGTGCLIGLPGQMPEDLADDILFFKSLDADMIGVGPFIPNPDTPMSGEAGGTFETALKVIAVIRLLMPDINIPATTAMEALNPNGRIIALQSGANVVMPNVTDTDYKKLYLLYPGKICLNESPDQCIGCIGSKIKSIGREISAEHGFRKNILNKN